MTHFLDFQSIISLAQIINFSMFIAKLIPWGFKKGRIEVDSLGCLGALERAYNLRTITLSEEEGIKASLASRRERTQPQCRATRFLKDKWTLEKAKAWFRQHEAKAKEPFSRAESIKEPPDVGNLIRDKAPHPTKTYHLEEWPEDRAYLQEEPQNPPIT